MNDSKITGSQIDFKSYSDDWYFYALHTNGICCTIGLIFSIYFIIWKSPRYMKDYKFFLLNISVTSFIFDSYSSILWIPVPLFPALVMCSHGLLGKLGLFWGGTIAFVTYLALCTMCSISVIWAFLYRLALITNKEHYIKSKTAIILMALFQIFYEAPTVILYLLVIRNRSEHIRGIIASYPNIAEYILPESKPCAASSFDISILTWMFMLSLAIEFGLPIPMALSILYLCNRALDIRKDHMTAKTIKMHRNFLKSLVLQLFIPFISLFIPYTIGAILLLLKIENVQKLYQILFLLGNLHSTLNTLMLLIGVEPYRRELISMYYKITGKLLGHPAKQHQVSSLHGLKTSTALSS